MPNTTLIIPRTAYHYYTLPKGIKTLRDDKIEWYKFSIIFLKLKLKDNDEVIEIEPDAVGEDYLDENLIEYDSDDEDDEDDEDDDSDSDSD